MKTHIIANHGELIKHGGVEMKALVGRLNRSGYDMFALENLREVIAHPATLTSGVLTEVFGSQYLTISVYPEHMRGTHISDVAVLLKCNVEVEYTTLTYKPDGKGNKVPVAGTPVKLQGYRLQDNEILKQFDAGMVSANKVVVFVGAVVPTGAEVRISGKKYKLLGADTTSYLNVTALRLEAGV